MIFTEFKRVFANRKTAILLIILILLCSLFYIIEQYSPSDGGSYDLFASKSILKEVVNEYKESNPAQTLEAINREKEDTYILYELAVYDDLKNTNKNTYDANFSEADKEIRGENSELAQLYDNNKELYSESYLNVKLHILDILKGELSHIASFKDKLEDLKAQAESISGISIFSESNSFSDKNINKTVEDYAPLENIELSFQNQEAAKSVVQFDFVHYLVLIFLIWIVFLFCSEQKKGLSQLVFTTRNGRLPLALKRAGILVFSAIAVNLIMYSILFGAAFYIYGSYEGLFCMVQSISLFVDFVIPMTVWQFLLYYIVFCTVSSFAVSVVVWLVMSAADEKHISITVFSIIFATEYALYYFITPQSNFCVFKYLNIFPLINPKSIIIKYRNIPFLGDAVNARIALTVFCIFTVVSALTACLIINTKKRPVHTQSKLSLFLMRQSARLRGVFSRAVARMSLIGKELYKIFVMQKGIIVLVIFVCIIVRNIPSGTVYYGRVDSIINDFYSSYSGEISEESKSYISNLEAEIETAHTNLIDTKRAYDSGLADEKELKKATDKYNSYSDYSQALDIIYERTGYIESVKEYQGIDAWYVNPYGYEKLLSRESYLRQEYNAVLAIITIIIILSGIFSFESKSNTNFLIRSTHKGRDKLFKVKLLTAEVVTVFIWCVTYAAEFFGIYNKYGLDCFNAPIQSLEFFMSFPLNISIGAYLMLMYLCRLLLMMSATGVIMLISKKLSYAASIAASIAILLIPALLNMVGVAFFGKLSLSVILSINQNITYNGFWYAVISMILIMLTGVFCVLKTRTKWNKSS
ncbi:MAG: hypothetical protein K6F76_07540 [Clostridiales bacterium]|nr:hypothetical protein [Clostridiales bacterium]